MNILNAENFRISPPFSENPFLQSKKMFPPVPGKTKYLLLRNETFTLRLFF